MKHNVFLGIMALCLVLSVLLPMPSGNSQQLPVGLHILENGSVDPPSAPVTRVGDVYTLTGDINGTIKVDRDNITIDGAGYTLLGTEGPFYQGGVDLHYRHGVTVKNLVVKNAYHAFDLTYANDNTIVGNTIIGSEWAVYVWFSSRNNVTGNTISKVAYAFEIFLSTNLWSQKNVFTRNIILDSIVGISLTESNNTFSDNIINSTRIGVSIAGHQNLFRNNTITTTGIGFKVSSFDNDVNESNLVNGKPIIHWIDHRDEIVPSDASYVILSNCKNITVQNLQTSDVNLFSTTNSLIAGNTLSGGDFGIQMLESSNNTITGNSVLYNEHGIELTNCNDNKIIDNNVSNNHYYGILLTNSHYNTMERNNVANNGFELTNDNNFPPVIDSGDIFGVKLLGSSNNHFTENNVTGNNLWGILILGNHHDNVIYHNNFIDNKISDGLQVRMTPPNMHASVANQSIWDDGTSGNYWSDYLTRYPNASEIGDTGVGDTPFYINPNNTDHYPLMEPFIIPEFPSWIILPIFVIATLFSLIIKKRLLRRHKE